MWKNKKKVPHVEQLQQTECGLCCVAMILRYNQSYETLHDLRECLDVGRDGVSMSQINQLLKKFNFNTKIYKTKYEGLSQIQLPAILFWENNHFVVLEKMTKKYVYIVDPALGKRKISHEDARNSYTSYVLTAKTNANFTPMKKKKSVWSHFFPILIEKKWLFLRIAIISVITYFCTLSIPILIEKIVDSSITAPYTFDVSKGILLIIGGALIYSLLNFVNGFQLINMKTHIDSSINKNLVSHILEVPYKFFEIRAKSDILFATNSSFIVRELFAQQLVRGIIDIGAIIVIISYMVTKSQILTLIAGFLFIINIICILCFRPFLVETNQYLVTEQSKLQGTQVEIIYSMLGIKMSSIEKDMFSSWSKRFKSYLNKFIFSEKVKLYHSTISEFIKLISPLIILCLSLTLFSQGKMSIGEVMSFYAISQTFFSLSSSLLAVWNSFVLTGTYLERMKDIITTKVEETPEVSNYPFVNGDIQLENVSFSYTSHSMEVIRDINLSIKKGQKIAIVGKSGSGKSTLAKILIGLYMPTKGKVYYGGKSIDEINRKELRRKMGIVPQDVTLFNKSIFDNIAMDREKVDIEQVKKACRIAQIDTEIENMPMGYYTMISEMGMNLSGGQRQRIVLARAIVNEPNILILDEATSSLDSINETKLSEYFSKIGCTRILIAHRLSTIIDSDLIIVLDNGKIVEKGTHQELMFNRGVYFDLYKGKDQVTYLKEQDVIYP